MKTVQDRVIVKLWPKNEQGLIDTGRISKGADGRYQGISNAINRAVADYLERV